MNHQYLVSIIVPTKNRAKYALKTAEQVLSIKDDNIQLVIQDNSDDRKLENMMSHLIEDKRLKYNYCPKLLSFVDNFGVAVSLADGEYICIIGDDDGINPEIVELAEWARTNNVKAIKPEVQAVYFWPDAIEKSNSTSTNEGYLNISKISGNIRMVDTSLELNKLLKNGCQRYLSFDLVKLYHGLVKKDCMDEILKMTGRYFGGLSPDIYSAVALSVIIPKVICIDYPITISGICKKSGSADSATGRHTGELKDAPHFAGHNNYKWAEHVPPFYSVETIWADSSLAALQDTKQTQLLDKFRLEYLSVLCINKHPQYKSLIFNHFILSKNKDHNNLISKKIKLRLAMMYVPVKSLLERSIRRILKGSRKTSKFFDIEDILDAQNVFSEYLIKNQYSIKNVIKKLNKHKLQR